MSERADTIVHVNRKRNPRANGNRGRTLEGPKCSMSIQYKKLVQILGKVSVFLTTLMK